MRFGTFLSEMGCQKCEIKISVFRKTGLLAKKMIRI